MVVTVWWEQGGLRRVVSLTDPEPHRADPSLELRRAYAASDKAVIDLVRSWLHAVRQAGRSSSTSDPTVRPVDRADAATDD